MPTVTVKDDPLLPSYRWNQRARAGRGAYIDARGRFVSRAAVRQEFDRVLDGLGREAADLTRSLRSEEVSLGDWQSRMMAITKQSHLIGGAMSRGGFYQLSESDFGRIGSRVRFHYDKLRDYANGIEDGSRRIHAGVSRQYAQQARQTFYEFETLAAEGAGLTEVRTILNARESCSGSGSCREQADLGWIPIGDSRFIPIGRRVCLGNCLCDLEYR